MEKELEEIKSRLDSLEKQVGKIFDSNRQYYATRDTAKAEALERVIQNMVLILVEKLKDE